MKTTKTHEEALALARRYVVENYGEPRAADSLQQWYQTFGFLIDFLNELYFPKPEQSADASAQLAEAAPPDAEDSLTGKEPSEEALKFVEWFLKLLKETDAPTMQVTDSSKRKWAQTYDRMIVRDKRTKEQIVAVCKWARNDPFWRQNFLSPNRLREKKDDVMWFDLFLNKIGPSGGGTMPVGPDIYKEPEGWREKAAQKWPDMQMPEKWTDLSSTIRNALLQK